jgi:hypothetical protein
VALGGFDSRWLSVKKLPFAATTLALGIRPIVGTALAFFSQAAN